MGAGLYPSASLRKEKASQGVSTAGAGKLILASRSVHSPRAVSIRRIGPHFERLVCSPCFSTLEGQSPHYEPGWQVSAKAAKSRRCSGLSKIRSGCHWTPMKNPLSVISMASTMPSEACATTLGPGATLSTA